MVTRVSETPWSVRMADSVMRRQPILGEKWAYEWGVVLKGIEQVWIETGHDKYFTYIKNNIDAYVQPDGSIRTYTLTEYNIDHLNTGKLLFGLWQTTGDTRYEKALNLLRQQLATHPRIAAGGFWHKNIYPHQMWLDGIYMGAAFLAQYASAMKQPDDFAEVVQQIVLIEQQTRDPETGLLYHGWDASRAQQWADPDTGCSPHFWGRAMGWFVMALVDVLEQLPSDHPRRGDVIAVLQRAVTALLRVQDQATGLWYQVLDQGARAGNYLEASASCMITYGLAKALRSGYLERADRRVIDQAYSGILAHLVEVDGDGLVNLLQVCSVAGLGGDPYRDGSYAYYINEPVVTNDDKGVGAFILAMVEVERLRQATPAD